MKVKNEDLLKVSPLAKVMLQKSSFFTSKKTNSKNPLHELKQECPELSEVLEKLGNTSLAKIIPTLAATLLENKESIIKLGQNIHEIQQELALVGTNPETKSFKPSPLLTDFYTTLKTFALPILASYLSSPVAASNSTNYTVVEGVPTGWPSLCLISTDIICSQGYLFDTIKQIPVLQFARDFFPFLYGKNIEQSVCDCYSVQKIGEALIDFVQNGSVFGNSSCATNSIPGASWTTEILTGNNLTESACEGFVDAVQPIIDSCKEKALTNYGIAIGAAIGAAALLLIVVIVTYGFVATKCCKKC